MERYSVTKILDAIGVQNSWSDMEISRQLGCNKNSILTWRKRGAPKYVKIALLTIASAKGGKIPYGKKVVQTD